MNQEIRKRELRQNGQNLQNRDPYFLSSRFLKLISLNLWIPLPRADFCCTRNELVKNAPTMTKFDLRREDCVRGMSQLPNERVDLVVTSPPYNLGVRYRKYSDREDRQSYLRWCREWTAQVQRILKSSGSFFQILW